MNLKELVKASGMKKYIIAERLGVSRQQYGNIEKGKYRISSDKAEILSEILGVTPLEIYKAWEGSKNDKKTRL